MQPLETDRLHLRPLTLADAPFILTLLNDPAFIRFIGDKKVRTLAEAQNYLTQGPLASYARFGFGLGLVARKADGAALGICGLIKRESLRDIDIGFAFLPQFWGQGYATEAAAAVMRHGQETLQLRQIVGIVDPENTGSIRVLEKLGLTFAGMITLPNDTVELKLFALVLPVEDIASA